MSDPTLHLPRILCLHGGGVTAKVFRLQSRTLIKQLQPHFRLCFADGLFLSEPGPCMIPTYQHYAPFHEIIDELDRSIEAAIAADDAKGATGDWVCASVLYREQIRAEKLSAQQAGSQFRSAVLLAARPPLVSLDTELLTSPALAEASEITTSGFQNYQVPERRISRPIIHWCEKGTARIVEWDGDHRVPVR
ncbi:hypothetical protein BDW68DRAFT_190720 [Aspergillus falconensis]